jgi:CSLREA domain-containing protein
VKTKRRIEIVIETVRVVATRETPPQKEKPVQIVVSSGRAACRTAVLAALIALMPSAAASAATFTVNSTADLVDLTPGNGVCATAVGTCTLRAAIMEGNALASPPHTIRLPAATYTLTIVGPGEDNSATGDLDIKQSMTLSSIHGQLVRIVGNNGPVWNDRIVQVFANATVVFVGLEIANGNSTASGGAVKVEALASLRLESCTVRDSFTGINGGGLHNTGTLTLVDSVVRDNLSNGNSAGIHNNGTLELTRSRVIGNAVSVGGSGGVFNSNSAVIVDSTIEGNNAGPGNTGGGIGNSGMMTIARSTISQNGSGAAGGGIQSGGSGGSLALTNVTLSGNVAATTGGGLNISGGTATLNNVTVTLNSATSAGGGIASAGGTLTIRNSIVGGNTGGSASDCTASAAPINSAGFNLIQNVTGCSITGDTTGNITGLNPRFGVFQPNGGPTSTHGLCTGVGTPEASCAGASPAIDSANPASVILGGCAITDQRGISRPQGPRCDMGAFEVAPVGGFLVTPGGATVLAGDGLLLDYAWTHTTDWHDLQSLQLRIVDGQQTIFSVIWDQTANTFSLINEKTGNVGPAAVPGSHATLSGSFASLHMEETRVITSPGRTATLRLALSFKPRAAGSQGRDYVVEVLATDDFGVEQGFDQAGTLRVERR